MKDLKAIRGRYLIERLIAEGEHTTQDFKYAISDARKIARSLSAFANCKGGRLLIGVKDNGIIAGVRNEEDIYVIEQAASLYLRPRRELRFTAYRAGEGEGAIVIRAEIDRSEVRPVQAMDTDGRWKAYYRVKDENILASPLMVKAWRRKALAEPMQLAFGEVEQMLMTMLRESEMVDPELFSKEACISRRTAEDIITRLYSLDVIDFAFSADRRFLLVAAEP